MTSTDDEATNRAADDDWGAPAEAPAVIENSHLARFELLHHGDVVSFADYRETDGIVSVLHLETKPELRGNGFSSALMQGLLGILRADGRKVRPICGVAAQYIRDHPEHHDLLA